ncbi:acetyltransferase [Colletotrichum navitas]|uniref:Acetyltransferase n=1 Tax=Colletotrichum navitas TaxID=681940 RepID=A0AAD8UYD6_9PEZI|nr:acetyltransferase [Colletotrichum navitas]KAK1573656.1 acetyltransferase [Colletotrichum navitas]
MAAIYTTVPEGLVPLLETHLPNSLPVLRRLQFTGFKGGMRPTARVIFASDAPLSSGAESGSPPQPRHFTVAYLDFGSDKETQLFMYSTLEDEHGTAIPCEEEERETAELQIMAALEAVRQVGREQPDGGRAHYPGACLVGTLATATRAVMIRRGATVRPRASYEYEKWLFQVEDVPEPDAALPEGATWGPATERDCEVVIARTEIPRQVKTLMTFPSLVLRLADETPIAWSFLGTDGSLSSLHCEPPYRRRGYAKALAARLFKTGTGHYGLDGWASADVAPDNVGSRAMCKSLNGRHAWNCSW